MINVFQPEPNYYKESTAALLLRPRVDDLVKEGGLDYKELNRRIVAENRTEGIPVDHNPVYGGISKEVCAVERQESFTIDDKIESFDKKAYHVAPRKVLVETDDSTIVTEANGFFGDPIKIDVNALLANLTTKVVSLEGNPVDGVFELNKVKLIVDESIKNPWDIDFSDETSIILTINPLKDNDIPLIFRPTDKNLQGCFVNISLMVVDKRAVAVIPEIEAGTFVTVAALNDTNATSFEGLKGETKAVISGTIVGNILNSETKAALTSVTCEVSIGNVFPENPTSYDMTGRDDVEKKLHTLFANVIIKQASMHDLSVILPIKYLADSRTALVPLTTLTIEQNATLVLTGANTGYTFRGEPCVVSDSVVSSILDITAKQNSTDVTLTVGDAVVQKALNMNQKSTKATVKVMSADNLVSPLTVNLEIDDQRPERAKEVFSAVGTFAATIADTDWNAGSKGQAWQGNSIAITSSLTMIKNQFGKEILAADLLLTSFAPINVNARVIAEQNGMLSILASDGVDGSTEGKATLYALLPDFSVVSMPVDVTITDSRT